jgi:hypothetical protein
MGYKLGLKPVVEQPRLKLGDYLHPDLPTPPVKFGHAELIQPAMFMNDRLSDCTIAGSIEEIRLLNAERKVIAPFSDRAAIANYSALTGYILGDQSTDRGADIHDLYEYRKTIGIADDAGDRHRIVAYAGLTPGDWDEFVEALYLFTTVGVGLQLPDYAQDQFNAGRPWQVLSGQHGIEGGHYVSACARDGNTVDVFTWGRRHTMEADFYRAFNSVAVVSFTEEMLIGDKTIDGFDRATLLADLPAFNTSLGGRNVGEKAA